MDNIINEIKLQIKNAVKAAAEKADSLNFGKLKT